MKFEDYREPKEDVIIDYSCNVNSDCTLKVIGEGICRSDKQRCVNKNSDSAILEENKNGVVCAAIEIPPSKCECVRNTCISYSCDYKDECDVMDSPWYNKKDFEWIYYFQAIPFIHYIFIKYK